MKKIIALTSVILILTLYNYPIFDDKKITFTIIFMCFIVIIFSVAKLYSSDEKEDYDSVEKEMDKLHNDDGIFQYTNDGFYFKQKNITEFIKWDEIISIYSFRIPSPFSERKQSGLEIITERKSYEFDYNVTPGIVRLTDQLYSYLPDWEEDSPMEINNFGLKKTKLYERKPLQ
ncbi:hypothetical protein KYG33_11635 [Chryseobacterium sp. D764]|uniref:hypothetical protein n=1 Tax=unclassified Chryseobacterium TaxID=2593645 RepID=UPI00098420D9|nr:MULTISPECIES: hypothetical protein [unclassified Chryseobacterium]QXU47474.1 hypothetical protein KYG33_11635 [Chryseobacterium sp. D764]